MTEHSEFPDSHWPEIRHAAESNAAEGVLKYLRKIADPVARRKLYAFAQSAMTQREWVGKSFDAQVSVMEAAIEEYLMQAREEQDPEMAHQLLGSANVMSYNLSANLADCWPGENIEKTKAHFEKGLAAADRCIVWRKELGKGPAPFSMAYWAKGMHELSLGLVTAAIESFSRSLEFAERSAEEEGLSLELNDRTSFSVILGHAYLAIAEQRNGAKKEDTAYGKAIACFEEQTRMTGEVADDAQFGIDQLEHVRQKYIG